jgi:hypothetical protein
MSHLTCIIVAGRRLASLGVCLRWPPLWLPVWLPPDSLNREAESHQRRVIGLHIYIPADNGLCKTLVIVSRRALSETSKTYDTPYQIMSNGFSAR